MWATAPTCWGRFDCPNNAFKRNANTEVTTDILILKKRRPGETAHGATWLNTAPHTNSKGEVIQINEYFVERPQMMLGEMRLVGRMYQRNEPTLVATKDILRQLWPRAVSHLPENVYEPVQSAVAAPALEQIIPAPGDVKPNALHGSR
jgi:hypothetical protein